MLELNFDYILAKAFGVCMLKFLQFSILELQNLHQTTD